ncbi:MAG: hypothetical protein Q4G27_00370 [Flavobacteriaceae bacterium]|nr:hypothetical protein [Flavobacteriaceae bacterium]
MLQICNAARDKRLMEVWNKPIVVVMHRFAAKIVEKSAVPSRQNRQ